MQLKHPKIKKNSRLSELDAIRGIAALMVVLFHYLTFFRPLLNYQFSKKIDFSYGKYGVQLFFVISGFVIFMSLKNIKDFAFKRFIRLYPTYWICLIITILFIYFFNDAYFNFTLKEKLANILMFQGLVHIKNIDGSYWSLIPELLFYIQMAIIYKLKLLKRIRYVLFIWLFLIYLSTFKASVLDVYFNLRFGMYFIAGICFYRIKFKEANFIEYIQIILCLIAVYFVFKDFSEVFVSILIFLTFYLFAKNKLTFLSNKILIFFGFISYPLYLTHQTIGFLLISKMKLIGIPELVSISIALIISIILAWLVTEYFEKIIIKKLREVWNKNIVINNSFK